ncbi:LOW QUALITY PROTEIN: hypothetical protein PHMEG_00011579 [Phytophthora megakarya]|uniref:DUF6570 domain-containing protein n=1 Tax=Phytophthora megakarya TaxID=4795 RepID=A0A225WCA6_9STRA|nr:LOW QUALITY PROTEIN: hypothetical protein PHMEG_00011579 [Phytophthora megakarya]
MMTKALHVDTSKLPEALVNQYRPPDHLTTLRGAMTTEVYDSKWILRWDTSRTATRLTIANGFFDGILQKQLRDLTLPERFTTQLANVVDLTREIRGRHRCIWSHCITFDCTLGPPISLLPRLQAGVSSYPLVMVGEFTAEQVDRIRNLHRIRNKSVRDMFGFYKSHNHLYADISGDEDVMNSVFTDDRVEQIFVEHIPDPDENEYRVIEMWLGLADDGTPVVEHANLTTTNTNERGEREFEIRRFNHIANDISGDLLARMFPYLFPFGRGGPGEHRRISFAEDEIFLLTAFDRISLANMYIQNHIRCQRFPHLLEGYENLSAEQLGKALLENERRRQGRLPWKSSEDTVAQRFALDLSGEVMPSELSVATKVLPIRIRTAGSVHYVDPQHRQRFGVGTLYGDSSLDTRFGILEARQPSKIELQEDSKRNDCASACLFIRQVDAFIRCALGMDPATHKRLPFRGLFGDIRTFFGMVETRVGPVLAERSCCGVKFSSQHVIRNALLKARPTFWPPWECHLSAHEIEDLARLEIKCRNSKQHAVNKVCDRKSVHASFCSETSNRDGTSELFEQANHRQMALCKADDDPFRNDALARLIEALPPFSNDARLSKQSLNYILSALVVLVNQHLWYHTMSCFKQSVVTANDSFCRYNFPRPRFDTTSFKSSGVELK